MASTVTDIGSNGTAGNPNGGSALATANSTSNTSITATGGAGYVATTPGASGGYGGYAAASALYNLYSGGIYAFQPSVSATGGNGGSNYLGVGYSGGNASSTVTLTEDNFSTVNSVASAQGGSGGNAQNLNGGNAGNAAAGTSISGNENITADASANQNNINNPLASVGGSVEAGIGNGGNGGSGAAKASAISSSNQANLSAVTANAYGYGSNGGNRSRPFRPVKLTTSLTMDKVYPPPEEKQINSQKKFGIKFERCTQSVR